MATERITMPITDLSCGSALILERVLARAPGVRRAYVNPATEMAYVEYDPEKTDPRQLIDVVEHAGFHAGAPLVR